MNIDRFKQRLKKASPEIIALGGSERALVEDALEFLRADLKNDSLNHDRFDAGEDGLDHILNALLTMPFLAKRRVVELHNAEKLDAKAATKLIDYINKPSSSSLLIIVFNKIDKRNKLISSLISKELLCEFESLSEQDFVASALHEAKLHSMELSEESAHFLALVVQKDLVALKSAIKKLSLQFENKKISITDIENHILAHGEQDVFLFARAMSEGKLSDALFSLGKIKNNRENALKLLGVIVWQMRVFVQIRACLDQGMMERDICKQVFVFSDRYRWMEQVAKKRPLSFHIQRLTKLLECDAALKSINIAEPLNLIEKVVYQSAVGMS